MARLRNITDDVLEVPALRATVEPDGVVECPDDLLPGFEEQTQTWAVVEAPKAPAKDEE